MGKRKKRKMSTSFMEAFKKEWNEIGLRCVYIRDAW
jgi:hypothetical protein